MSVLPFSHQCRYDHCWWMTVGSFSLSKNLAFQCHFRNLPMLTRPFRYIIRNINQTPFSSDDIRYHFNKLLVFKVCGSYLHLPDLCVKIVPIFFHPKKTYQFGQIFYISGRSRFWDSLVILLAVFLFFFFFERSDLSCWPRGRRSRIPSPPKKNSPVPWMISRLVKCVYQIWLVSPTDGFFCNNCLIWLVDGSCWCFFQFRYLSRNLKISLDCWLPCSSVLKRSEWNLRGSSLQKSHRLGGKGPVLEVCVYHLAIRSDNSGVIWTTQGIIWPQIYRDHNKSLGA